MNYQLLLQNILVMVTMEIDSFEPKGEWEMSISKMTEEFGLIEDRLTFGKIYDPKLSLISETLNKIIDEIEVLKSRVDYLEEK